MQHIQQKHEGQKRRAGAPELAAVADMRESYAAAMYVDADVEDRADGAQHPLADGCAKSGSRRPVILVTPRLNVEEPRVRYPEPLAPEQVIADVFMDAIMAAGGLPLLMPITRDMDVLDTYLAMADAVALPGGHDVDPALWGQEGYDPALLCPERDEFELAVLRRALAADLPVFATCRGAQLLNVALGGTLDMDAPSRATRPRMAPWRHIGILHNPAHPVEVVEGSLLHRALGGVCEIQANSAHHCCIDRLGEGVRLVAEATDGMPEAIEVEGKRFVLGVQWHPEYTWRAIDTDFNLWKAFVAAAREYHAACHSGV